MNNELIQDITESEFLDLVIKICVVDYKTEYQHTQAVMRFERLSEHPDGSDLIYYPKPSSDNSPEGIVKEVKEWRAANGKPSFKSEN
ncbi:MULTISPECIES: bacteriocin immunity protein [unclassified Pseudomonas]|uniref:bacteriocin immunity protein n=1 Tax=unclassified Pseudomonas TaxID=196821 RepID=UPI000D35666B|nr:MULTISPECIES: bacteriocin immunity protein [unclassified Pseudomonas]RAU48711.1 bacteriocin immunity protein [Pseudomonas sp. RIT 409]RAU54029.1 bacteriocin immunity protein [Pseudomonas sp. RIT 412]